MQDTLNEAEVHAEGGFRVTFQEGGGDYFQTGKKLNQNLYFFSDCSGGVSLIARFLRSALGHVL